MKINTEQNKAWGCVLLVILGVTLCFILVERQLVKQVVPYNPKLSAWVCTRGLVESKLESPSTAKFPRYDETYVRSLGGAKYKIVSYVDSQNSVGTMIRTYFVVTLELTDTGYQNASISLE